MKREGKTKTTNANEMRPKKSCHRCTAVVAVFTTVVFFSLARMATAESGESSESCLCLKKVLSSLYNPVEYVTIRRHNSLLTLIVEQRGVVRVYLDENRERPQAFLNITDRITTSDSLGEERGLLSLALHPNYTNTTRGRLFVYYITTINDRDYGVISEFEANDDVVDVTSERQLLRMEQNWKRTNGGQLLFGDDAFLYIFTGDDSTHDAFAEHGQDLRSFRGKALRVDINRQGFEEGKSARAYLYGVPSDNPFNQDDTPGARPEIYALGFRNPWRCSQDSTSRGGTGEIFCGDTGTNLFDEINIVKKGRNYGWNLKEGDHCFDHVNCSKIENEEGPVFSYPYSRDWGSAVVGGIVYRGKEFPPLIGQYIYADAVSGQVYRLERDKVMNSAGHWTNRSWPVCPEARCPCQARDLKPPFLLAFGRHPNGELMLMMSAEFSALRPKGTLYQAFAPTGKPVTCASCRMASTTVLAILTVCIVLTHA